MAILVIAEHRDGQLSEQTAKAVSAALKIGGDIDILVAGTDVRGPAGAASALAGISTVLIAEDERLKHQLAEPFADLIAALAAEYDTILAPASAHGKNVMPRVAALLDVMQVSEVIDVVSSDTFKRLIYAGNAIQTVQCLDAKKVLTVRTASFKSAPMGGSAAIETIAFADSATAALSKFVGEEALKSDRPDLTSARIVISGGRAFGSAEKFDALISPIANKLNAAIGASRAAVDAGYVANDLQVGQTGKIVAPDLYIACGISGALQHLAGMKDSRIIVAINSDEAAPIFQVADYGLVGDLFELLPEFERLL